MPLGPVRLGALQSLITAFCNLAINSSLGTDLQPALVERDRRRVRLELWEKFRQGGEPSSEICGKGVEEDTLSLPDSLPDLIDTEEGEEYSPLIGLIEKGVLPQGLALRWDVTRFSGFWLC